MKVCADPPYLDTAKCRCLGYAMKHSLPRSALFMPGSNTRAMEKARTLDCDAVILDLEDSVAPDAKDGARANVQKALGEGGFGERTVAVRTNGLDTAEITHDWPIAQQADAVVVPKISTLDELGACQAGLGGSRAALWVMIETPQAILNIRDLARQASVIAPSLTAFVIGANDLAKDTGVRQVEGRWNMLPWFSEVVLAASAAGLGVLDSVSNNFRALDAFATECEQGADLGMQGKTLIHPAQIEPCNRAFAPTSADIERAQAIISTFAEPTNTDKGAIQINGEMVERLHIGGAQEILRRAKALNLFQG